MTCLYNYFADKKGNLSTVLTALKDQGVTGIDDDLEDPLLCSLYAADIYDTMRVAEVCAINTMSFVCSSHVLTIWSYVVVNCGSYESKQMSTFFCQLFHVDDLSIDFFLYTLHRWKKVGAFSIRKSVFHSSH